MEKHSFTDARDMAFKWKIAIKQQFLIISF